MATKNYDETINLAQGGDTGYDDAPSVQPISGAETVWAVTADRPIENLRKRTEALRQAVQDLNYFADYDRASILRSDGVFAYGSGGVTLTGADLWIYPALTPGRASGGRNNGGVVFSTNGGSWLPYSGTAGVNDLTLTATSKHTGQRGYADGVNFDGGGNTALSLGANGIVVNLVANSGASTGTITVAITGTPKRTITITYGTSGGSTTLAQLITYINGDTTSQGTYGVANYLYATSTGTTSNPPTAFTNGIVQGAYDAEAHQVTAAQLTAFFAIGANALNEGEGLALGYPAGPVDTSVPTPKGGRRQSVWDLPLDRSGTAIQNTSPSVGYMLFNTGREPEKIPGAVPIGKVINGRFVFVDGTSLAFGGDGLHLGESSDILARLAATTTPEGASLIGFTGGTNWHSDQGRASTHTVEAALDEILTDLAAASVGNSGSRRIGGEVATGDASLGNNATVLTLTASSLRKQILQALNDTNAGINRRVSENGHRLHGVNPIEKHFADDTASGGSAFRVVLNAPINLIDPASPRPPEYADVTLQPLVYDFTMGGTWLAATPIVFGSSGNSTVKVSSATSTQKTLLHTVLGVGMGTLDPESGEQLFAIMASIQGSVGGVDGDGFYLVNDFDGTAGNFTLSKLDQSSPDFSSTTFTSATITVYNTTIVGSDYAGHRVRGYHMNPGAYAVFALQNSSQVMLRLYDPYNYARSGSSPSMELGPSHARWLINQNTALARPGTNPASSTRSITRDTNNILNEWDHWVLAGNEYNSPIDASASHHHSSTYTQTHYLGGVTASLAFNTAGAGPAVSALPDYITVPYLPITLPNSVATTVSGVIAQITLNLQSLGSASVGTSWGASILTNPGAVVVSGSEITVFEFLGMKINSPSTPDTYVTTIQVLVPCDTLGRFMVSLGVDPSLNTAASTITIKAVAYLLAPT